MSDPNETIQITLTTEQVEYLILGLKDLIEYNQADPRIGDCKELGSEPRSVMLENMILDNSELIRILQAALTR